MGDEIDLGLPGNLVVKSYAYRSFGKVRIVRKSVVDITGVRKIMFHVKSVSLKYSQQDWNIKYMRKFWVGSGGVSVRRDGTTVSPHRTTV